MKNSKFLLSLLFVGMGVIHAVDEGQSSDKESFMSMSMHDGDFMSNGSIASQSTVYSVGAVKNLDKIKSDHEKNVDNLKHTNLHSVLFVAAEILPSHVFASSESKSFISELNSLTTEFIKGKKAVKNNKEYYKHPTKEKVMKFIRSKAEKLLNSKKYKDLKSRVEASKDTYSVLYYNLDEKSSILKITKVLHSTKNNDELVKEKFSINLNKDFSSFSNMRKLSNKESSDYKLTLPVDSYSIIRNRAIINADETYKPMMMVSFVIAYKHIKQMINGKEGVALDFNTKDSILYLVKNASVVTPAYYEGMYYGQTSSKNTEYNLKADGKVGYVHEMFNENLNVFKPYKDTEITGSATKFVEKIGGDKEKAKTSADKVRSIISTSDSELSKNYANKGFVESNKWVRFVGSSKNELSSKSLNDSTIPYNKYYELRNSMKLIPSDELKSAVAEIEKNFSIAKDIYEFRNKDQNGHYINDIEGVQKLCDAVAKGPKTIEKINAHVPLANAQNKAYKKELSAVNMTEYLAGSEEQQKAIHNKLDQAKVDAKAQKAEKTTCGC